MRTGVPGLHIPDEVDRRLRAVPADQVAEEGLRICVEIIEQIREIPGVSGVHVMAPGYEHGIPGILERAGLGQRGVPGGFQGGRPPRPAQNPAPAAPTLGGAGAD
jgi:methylenetetrahydrofolate reductase (NADPH)